jgi:uncharacterized protein (DUF302 family)
MDPPSEQHPDGLVRSRSSRPVAETADLLGDACARAGVRVFARIDQADAARSVGLALDDMILLVVGNPAGGTPLLARQPTVGIDLPLKILVWSDGETTSVATNDAHWLAGRHDLDADETAALAGLGKLIEHALDAERGS